MKVALFTAADADFFPLLEGMLASLRIQLAHGIRRVDSIELILFDDGLTAEQRNSLPKDIQIIDTKDHGLGRYYSNYVGGSTTSTFFSLAIRPYLFKFAGKADVCLWVDADVWFQDGKALEDLIWGTRHGELVGVPETGRIASYAYAHRSQVFMTDLFTYFGEGAMGFARFPVINGGLFAIRTVSKVWELWQQNLDRAMRRTSPEGQMKFGMDQVSLNYTVYHYDMPWVSLPDTHNFTLLPAIVDGVLCFPFYPFEKIHAIHLIGTSKWGERSIHIRNQDGDIIDTVSTFLDYKSISKLLK